MSRLNQKAKVLQWLEKYGSISPWEAMQHLRIMRLAARIGELEKDGIKIVHWTVTEKDEDGHMVRYMRYRKAV